MALPAVVDSVDKIPEAQRSLYVQREGKFVLDIDGQPHGFVPAADLATANGKVAEFRTNNVALLQEVEPLRKLKSDLGDVDPVAAKTAVTELKTLKDKGVGKPDDIGALIKSSVDAALKPVQDQLAAQTATLAAERTRADDATFRSVISEKFTKAGGKASALGFIVGEAKDAFEIREGHLVAKATKFSPTNPHNPLSVDEWVTTATKTYDFAFAPSQGGGAPPANSGSGAPHRADQTVVRNPTPQQLGDKKLMAQVKEGKVRFEYDEK